MNFEFLLTLLSSFKKKIFKLWYSLPKPVFMSNFIFLCQPYNTICNSISVLLSKLEKPSVFQLLNKFTLIKMLIVFQIRQL